MQLEVKKLSLPARCEICHQSDLFDPLQNHCRRCVGINIPAQKAPQISSTRIRDNQLLSTQYSDSSADINSQNNSKQETHLNRFLTIVVTQIGVQFFSRAVLKFYPPETWFGHLFNVYFPIFLLMICICFVIYKRKTCQKISQQDQTL